MNQIKRLLVGFDLSDTDEILIKYCAYLGHKLNIDKIYFLHVAKSLELPPEIVDKYPDLIAPVDENIRHELMRSVNFHFTEDLKEKTEVIILEGSPESTFLKEIKIKEIDLLVMGHKKEAGSSGYLSKKMARLAHCSVGLVADNIFEHSDIQRKLLVPVDFSVNSSYALALSNFIVSKNENIENYCVHIYNVPTGYSKTGKSFSEFASIMLENSKQKMKDFIRKNDINLSDKKIEYSLATDNDISKSIIEFAANHKMDGIIIGSKGRTDAASFFLGSTTEKLISEYKKSIIIVKDKKHNMDFMEVLLKI